MTDLDTIKPLVTSVELSGSPLSTRRVTKGLSCMKKEIETVSVTQKKCDYCNTIRENSQMTTGIRGGVRTIRNICKFCENARKREYYNRTPEKQKQKLKDRIASGKSAECSRRMREKYPEKVTVYQVVAPSGTIYSRGLSTGGDIEYADELTLTSALTNRKELV